MAPFQFIRGRTDPLKTILSNPVITPLIFDPKRSINLFMRRLSLFCLTQYIKAARFINKLSLLSMFMNCTAKIEESMLALVARTSTDLPCDVEKALRTARSKEAKDNPARWAMDTILTNVSLAREEKRPVCQDTGNLLFYARVPRGFDTIMLEKAVCRAVRRATTKGFLRRNTIESVSGMSIGTNVGKGMPVIKVVQENRKTMEVRLLMKGGGSENVSCQYSLPDRSLGADRDMDGVRKCVLDALVKAQGMGCAPGVPGICIGGDRATGAEHAKMQFFRLLNDRNRDPGLARLESRILREANTLTIGPMGFGGKNTLLGVKIGVLCRLPASYFVSVAYMCWAFRRRGIRMDSTGRIAKWLYV